MPSPRRYAPLLLSLALTIAACSAAAPAPTTMPPELEKPYPWRLAPVLTEAGPEARFEWFAHHAVDEDTRAFVRTHGPALAEVRLGLEQALGPVDGARLMTRATKPGRPQLKSPASVEEKILRLWEGSTRAWTEGRKGLFAKGATLGEARQQVFDAAPDDPRALTDVAGLRVVVPTLASLDEAVAGRRAVWEGRIIKHRDYVGEDHRGDGYRSVHFVIEARGRPVEVQLRTTRMHRWAGWEHRIVYKGKFKGDVTVTTYTKAVGDRLHRQDQGNCEAPCPLPACPVVLQEVGDCFQEAR